YSTLIASKAARMVDAAGGRPLVDFGLRRAHGADAGLLAARAAWLAGFAGTSNVQAGIRQGIPAPGTTAHSFMEEHHEESPAFGAFARSDPQNAIFLIDTYDTEAGARKVAELAPALRRAGIEVGAIRLDSGDLAAHAVAVRAILDGAGLR